jgi:adenine-specific DNA-methyltransferase
MATADGTKVAVTAAKGRPMLSWVGKRPLRDVRSFPAQLVERFAPPAPAGVVSDAVDWSDWPTQFDRGGLLFHGDNKEVLAHLLANGFRGKVDLVYIDPPFDSGADYVRKVQLRGASGSARLGGEDYTLGEQIQYTDIWANDTYLQFMYERLLLIKELMAANSSVFLHCDTRKSHYLRCLMDEVFGQAALVNEIIWRNTTFTGSSKAIAGRYPSNHNAIYWYCPDGDWTFNKPRVAYTDEYIARFANLDDDPRGPWQSVSLKTYSPETFARLKAERRLIAAKRPGAGWRFKFYLEEAKGKVVETLWLDAPATALGNERVGHGDAPTSSIWLDINMANAMADERTGYPTEKPDLLLDRIVGATSNPGDIVLDCFIGSGTTAAVAQKLGRRWIGADINKGAIQTTEKRLAAIIEEQIAAGGGTQLTIEADADAPARPAQASFSVQRVNDYDLQIQHNEALELAIAHLGITRMKTDPFFTGTLGSELAYVVGFDHPATQLDLQAVARELEARPGEERNVVVVGLGRELSTQAWLDEWNRHRPINKVRLIDLRTDPKHGRFFEHRPATARVTFSRADDKIMIRIDDFLSPSILERLSGEEGILAPSIDDWRAMVDSVAIDTAYDGAVFDVELIDIPTRRSDLVEGAYELDVPIDHADRPAAVRITDMLGEEVLVVEART